MSEHIERRAEDRLERRMDNQDTMLREILRRIDAHSAEHAAIDPSVKELVEILKGMKFLKGATVLLASVIGSLWMTWLWVKDHIRL